MDLADYKFLYSAKSVYFYMHLAEYMMNYLIGRVEEKQILNKTLSSREAEMLAIIGRRRVGKTFLIKSVYAEQIIFEITGIQNAPYQEQLQNFTQQLNLISESPIQIQTPKNWLKAFFLLTQLLEEKMGSEKKVVFFDELPWLASQRSGFLRAFSYFWNSWAVNKNIVVVICGSAASWMIEKVVNNTGGLYNRITRRIFLKEFTLSETEAFLKSRQIHLDRYQIVQLYMTLGGIPHHLKEVEPKKSAIQNINQICFAPNGLLRDEFSQLYPALFTNAEKHLAIIRALSSKRQGLTRKQIADITGISNGGAFTKVIEELRQSNFISVFKPFGKKKKERLYRLTDEYSLFYLYFIEKHAYQGDNTWYLLSQTQSYKIWSGYAFENICMKHIPQIKKALGIAGVYSVFSSFFKKGDENGKGAQIDLLIDRNDHMINLFEIKFHKGPFRIDKAYAEKLRHKMSVFSHVTKTSKFLSLSMITSFGLEENMHSQSLNIQSLTLDDLFD